MFWASWSGSMREGLNTTTSTTLLEGLFDPANVVVWDQFDARYRPIILGFARRLGLNEADAADVAQDTLVRFLRDYRLGKYDRTRGALRSWIISIVKFRIADLHRARESRRERRGESAFIDLVGDDAMESIWEAERRRAVLAQALVDLRQTSKTSDKSLRAFEMYALQEVSAETVAQKLDMSLRDVYMAKNRVAERLRDILSRLEELFDDGPPLGVRSTVKS